MPHTSSLALANKQLITLIFVFCGKNVVQLGFPIMRHRWQKWWRERQRRKRKEAKLRSAAFAKNRVKSRGGS